MTNRLSQYFHSTSATAGATAGVSGNEAELADNVQQQSDESQTEALPGARTNIRQLVEEVLKEIETNPACETIHKKYAKNQSTPRSIAHYIGSRLPAPIHDFLKKTLSCAREIAYGPEPLNAFAAATDSVQPTAQPTGDGAPTDPLPPASSLFCTPASKGPSPKIPSPAPVPIPSPGTIPVVPTESPSEPGF